MKAKRIPALFFSLLLALSLTACSGNEPQANTDGSSGGQTSAGASLSSAGKADSGSSSKTVSAASADSPSKEPTASSKTLVLYFSAANSKNADVISSATPMKNGLSSTQQLATLIHEEVGGDLVKIIPTNDYPLGYDEAADKAKEERDHNERPSFEVPEVAIEEYDTIYIGYPMWWYTVPMIVNTFFDTYDFSGKTIIPFNTHEGSGDGGTYATIRELEPGATVKDGLAVRGGNVYDDSTRQQVKDWVAGLE